jgi:GLPGLI family protein
MTNNKSMKTNVLLFALLILTSSLFAQTHFVSDGTIEFEKSVNMYTVIKKQVDMDKGSQVFYIPMFEQFKKTNPQFKTLKSTLSFTKDKTLYEPVPSADNKYMNLVPSVVPALVEQNSTIYTDLAANSSINQKVVFDQAFLVKDNARKIIWKITDETRDIAGYSCRRANGIMLDSVYVVAFYAIAIPVSGGPESFSGLPGMILGVALPHDNVTWFATKVSEKILPPLKVPAKGKAVNNKELEATLNAGIKNRGTAEQVQMMMKALLL